MRKTSVSELNQLANGLAEYLAYKNQDNDKIAFRMGRKLHSLWLENDTSTTSFTVAQQELMLNMRDALFNYNPWLVLSVYNKDKYGEIKYLTVNEEKLEYIYKDVQFSARIDQYRVFESSKTVIIIDLKSCRDVSDLSIQKSVADYGTLTQNASYQVGFKKKYPKYKDYKFIHLNVYISKQEQPICRMVNWSEDDIQHGLDTFNALINKFKRIDELRLDKAVFKENSIIPEPIELEQWAYKKSNKIIEKWT